MSQAGIRTHNCNLWLIFVDLIQSMSAVADIDILALAVVSILFYVI